MEKMLGRILTLEEGTVPAKNARGWKIEEQNKKGHRKACKMWDIAKKRMLEGSSDSEIVEPQTLSQEGLQQYGEGCGGRQNR